MITGEDAPLRDAATLARLVLVPFPWAQAGSAGDYRDLSAAQALSHQLPAVGRSWVEWLAAPDTSATLEGVRELVRAAQARWSARLLDLGGVVNWQRLAMNLALNDATWQIACAHPHTGDVLRVYTPEHEAGLDLIAVEMSRLMKQSSEAEVFLEALRQLLAAGEVVLLKDNEAPLPGKTVIGRVPNGELGGAYVLPEMARGAVEKLLGKGGLNGITNETLYRHLAELGYLMRREGGRTTITARINGSTQRVLHLAPHALGWTSDKDDE